MCASCVCRHSDVSLFCQDFAAYYLHHPKKGVGWGYSLPTTPTTLKVVGWGSSLPITLLSPTSVEEGNVGGSLAAASSDAAVLDKLPLVPRMSAPMARKANRPGKHTSHAGCYLQLLGFSGTSDQPCRRAKTCNTSPCLTLSISQRLNHMCLAMNMVYAVGQESDVTHWTPGMKPQVKVASNTEHLVSIAPQKRAIFGHISFGL